MSSPKIDQTVTIKTTRASAFKAISDAKELMSWFPTEVESDAKTGGAFKFSWEWPSAPEQNGTQEGNYILVVDNESVSYPWSPDGEGVTNVTFSLSDNANGGVDVTLVHGDWNYGDQNQAMIDRHEPLWGFYMMNLKSYLEDGVDNRIAQMGQATR